jgi:hypothetical protein
VVIATVEGQRYLVSMLGPESDWVKNVEATHGDAVVQQGRRCTCSPRGRAVGAEGAHPPRIRANRVERRRHLPLPVGTPLTYFEEIAGRRYPVSRIDTL